MNKSRRSRLIEAMEKMNLAKAIVLAVLEEEESALDSLPENLQSSERADKMEAAIEAMNEAIDSITEAHASLEKASE